MILSDRDIKKALRDGHIRIDPSPDLLEQLKVCSIDFHLGDTFRIFEYNKLPLIDPRQKTIIETVTREVHIVEGEQFIVHPGELVIAACQEWLEIDNTLVARLEGRSSLARMGIIVHSTAARFDPGWTGRPVLELGNLGRIPVALYSGMGICSFTFELLSSPAEISYQKQRGMKYAGQAGPVASKYHEEFKTEITSL